jgi:FkbM family methyltransferase
MKIPVYVKRMVALMPVTWQLRLKQYQFHCQIRNGTFESPELEFFNLSNYVKPGDWAFDIGANVGTYTVRLSKLVGAHGRVIAFEPVPETFALLTSNVKLAKCCNVTLINAAVSDAFKGVVIDIPTSTSGLINLQESRITSSAPSSNSRHVLAFPLNAFMLQHRVNLVKIDAEGHERTCLEGMLDLLLRDHPTLIVETATSEIIDLLTAIGYAHENHQDSPNTVFTYPL